MNIKLRPWQQDAREVVSARRGNVLIEAGVGAGKTTVAGAISLDEIESGEANFVLVVVPTTPLKTSFVRTFARLGIQLTPNPKAAHGRPANYDGAVITYAALQHMLSTLEIWSRNGTKVLLIFDEIHHCAGGNSESNRWGASAESAARSATRVISMSGTPFRSDGRKISFINYYDDGSANADVKYTYEQSVADRWCRPVMFMHDDSVANYTYGESVKETRVSEAADGERGRVAATVFQAESEFLKGVIVKAKRKLEELRLSDADAACLVVCRPGHDDEDDRHMLKVAQAIEELTGDKVQTVAHDEPDAAAKIEAFERGQDKWICSVRMISEGINIPRLRVLVLATATDSEMLFRQIVGRIVRQEDSSQIEEATAYIAKFPHLVRFAAAIRREAESGLEKRAADDQSAPRCPGDRNKTGFVPLRATHEDGGGVAHGERYDSTEITVAERFKTNDVVLSATPLHVIAHLLRKVGFKPEPEPATVPLHERQMQRRKAISNLLRQLGVIYRETHGDRAFQTVAVASWRALGVKDLDDLIDNHPESKAEAAIKLLQQEIAKASSSNAA